VLIGDRNETQANAAAAELDARYPGTVTATAMDVRDSASVAVAARQASAEFGGIDIWVNNAGIFPSIAIADMTDEDWEGVFAVNARGAFLGAREAVRAMTAQGRGGVIVNVASLAGLNGISPGLAAYVSSKHAVVGLTRQLALECAPQRIRVLAVAPSFMVTEGNMAMMQQDPRIAEAAAEHIPSMFSSKLGRVGVPDDIARAVLFCASDMSIFMTGTTIVVDAGETA
jgi:NAD(P)-dependent dehydrogenase (short-subunit alcohol dehydrogenase family)